MSAERAPSLEWRCGDRKLRLRERPLIMGVLNVTPDSFSDGGRYLDPAAAVARGLEMLEEGADLLDVGGESTRPGAADVPAEEELRRVAPVVQELCRDPAAVVSVDTTKAAVARRALACGARIVNDVSALTADPGMAAAAREAGAGVILMHRQGTPRTMQENPQYGEVVTEVRDTLEKRIEEAVAQGLDRRSLAVDPGIGFGKTLEHNLRLLARLPELARLGAPVVVGVSRKSFLGRITGRPVEARLPASLAALVFCVLNGAHVMRVHDVRASREAVETAAALSRFRGEE